MSDVILAVLERPEAAAHLLRAAERLAVLTRATRVNVLAVRTPPGYAALTSEAAVGELLADLIALEDERIAALEAAFRRWEAGLTEAPLRARWSSVEGLADPIVNEGCRADFIVVARPESDDDEPTRRAFHAALFRTERPVLVVPPGWAAAFGRRVAIAWKDDNRAAKAVLPALRCMGSAEQVHVLLGARQAAVEATLPPILSEHGVQAELHMLPIFPGTFGQALLDKAHELGADLLVMGAYAHSQLLEALLGGVTRHMLAQSDLPVLMRH
ncbi:universal stress protein [Roseomonas harenae]|uniref:universal stress protein n=1 Tax=Muricoccus harenae TaxID=2692566 RepID=UPI0013314D97|nr:universal stress protein [Roseomonas harenae]